MKEIEKISDGKSWEIEKVILVSLVVGFIAFRIPRDDDFPILLLGLFLSYFSLIAVFIWNWFTLKEVYKSKTGIFVVDGGIPREINIDQIEAVSVKLDGKGKQISKNIITLGLKSGTKISFRTDPIITKKLSTKNVEGRVLSRLFGYEKFEQYRSSNKSPQVTLPRTPTAEQP